LFSLSAASLAGSLSAGTPVQKLLSATLAAHGTFSGAIQWSITGMPTGVTATIGTNPDAALPVIDLIASAAAVIGTYTAQLVGTYGSFQTSTPFTITVVA
jgi:hypothetical protein